MLHGDRENFTGRREDKEAENFQGRASRARSASARRTSTPPMHSFLPSRGTKRTRQQPRAPGATLDSAKSNATPRATMARPAARREGDAERTPSTNADTPR